LPEALGSAVYVPRFDDPAAVVPSKSWYAVTPLPGVQEKVAEDPGSTVLGAGLTRTAGELGVVATAVPVPARLTVPVEPEDASLLKVRLPVAAPAAAGLN
jgi:hypothetical protein